jgi:hypothetical protein
MRKWIGWSLVGLCLAAAPAQAGWSFKQTMSHTGGREAHNAGNQSRVQVEGDDARIDFEKMMENPMFGKGAYMLMRGNAPKGLFLVNPEKKTYSKFDPAGLSQSMAPAMNAGEGSGMGMKVSDAKFEKLLEEPGGEILGRPTTHYRYHKSYVMTMEMANFKMTTAHDIVEDVWLTTAVEFGGGGLAKVMRNMGGGAELGELEKLAALEREKQHGFSLKSVTTDHATPQGKGMMARMMGGKEETITSTMLVSELEQKSIPADVFAIPHGYTETQMMQPGAQAPDLEDEH